MELLLVNEELAESRMYRATRAFSNLNGRDIADLLYLHTLMVYMLTQDRGQSKYGIEYAEATAQYSGYSSFRTSGTDLYTLAYAASNPESRHVHLDDANASKKFLLKLNFDKRAHWRFIHDLSRDDVSHTHASAYLFRLENQLKIKDSRYKNWRRIIVDWQDKTDSTHRSTAAKLKQELRRIAKYGELLVPLTNMSGYDDHKDIFVPKLDTPTFGDKVKGAAIGAIAGRYVAAKIADKTGGDKAKMKQIGTGLGAIAGYWNAGRQRKQN